MNNDANDVPDLRKALSNTKTNKSMVVVTINYKVYDLSRNILGNSASEGSLSPALRGV